MVFLNVGHALVVLVALFCFSVSACKAEEQKRASQIIAEKQECDEEVTIELGDYVLRTHRKNSPTVTVYDERGKNQYLRLSQREHCEKKVVKNAVSFLIGRLGVHYLSSEDVMKLKQSDEEELQRIAHLTKEKEGLIYYGDNGETNRIFVLNNGIDTFSNEPVIIRCQALFCGTRYLVNDHIAFGY
ncbi:MAG: hypothetical protein VX740_03895, partial [Pseudomonadota bacterium]|nr:hypothetical protein [Pseudomonadota bacterium]